MNKKIGSALTLIFFIAFVLFVGYFSSIVVGVPIKDLYSVLNKPSFAPPAALFGPVWAVLYILMGISAFLIWQKKDEKDVNPATAIFFIQLFLNYIWTIIFFGRSSYGLALIDLVALWIAIVATIMIFRRFSKTAAILLIPYLFWVTFAGVLNFYIWKLN
jgi:tryptophan-rich sensory protein